MKSTTARKRFNDKVTTAGETKPSVPRSTLRLTIDIPCVRGIQSGREYYTGMVRLSLLRKLFIFDEEEVPPELRSQRELNQTRARKFKEYVLDNKEDYVVNSITVMIDCEMDDINFVPQQDGLDIGTLRVAMDAKFLIQDGQHRCRGFMKAVEEDPDLGDETVSVIFFLWTGVKRAQQVFHDLNNYSAKTSKSLNLLYDHRNPESAMVRSVLKAIPLFERLTDCERTSVGKQSSKIFTLNGLEEATTVLVSDLRGKTYEEKQETAIAYWKAVAGNMADWQAVHTKQLAPSEVRQNQISAHAIGLLALGHVGRRLLIQQAGWEEALSGLSQIDWSRHNPEWQDAVIFGGAIKKNRTTAEAMAEIILNHLKRPG